MAIADWISLKIDSVDEALWRRINRPNAALDHCAILDGLRTFAGEYTGTLVTESMLVAGLNDTAGPAQELAEFRGKLAPEVAYLSVPTRPPAEKDTCPPDEAAVNRVYQQVCQHVAHVELLTGYEGNASPSAVTPWRTCCRLPPCTRCVRMPYRICFHDPEPIGRWCSGCSMSADLSRRRTGGANFMCDGWSKHPEKGKCGCREYLDRREQ